MLRGMRSLLSWLSLGVVAVAISGCPKTPTTVATTPTPTAVAAATPIEVKIYTSVYREVVDILKEPIDAKLKGQSPAIKVTWVQAGSRKIAARLEEEWAAGKNEADILLTADPAFYKKLKADGKLVAYKSPEAERQGAGYRDPEGYWATARFSTMVIGVSPEVEAGMTSPKPASFKDLADAKGLKRVAMGDPSLSGTTFTAVATLSKRLGWDYFKDLKKKKALSAGSNSTVQQRLDTGESDAGICLLENLLLAKAGGSKVGVVYPKEGAIVIPGPIALLPHAKDSKPARAVYDAILSAEIQKILVEKGGMHSADPAMPTPAGAPKLEELLGTETAASIYDPAADSEAIKNEFIKIFAKAENK